MKYGKMPKKDMVKENGKYPVFSGYRIVGYCDECNLDKQQLIVVARGVGGTGDVKLSPGACFLTNLSIAVIIDENIALKQYLFYYFQKHNLRYLDSGSAQSQITIADLKNIVLPIPPLEIQSKIVEILSSFDDKIELNNKINENLEKQAEAIYQKCFGDVDIAKKQGILSDICTYSKEKVAVSKLEANTYFSTVNMLPGKSGAAEASTLPTAPQTTACHIGDTLISNIRPYFKKIVYCYNECGCSSDVLCFTPVHSKYAAYLYSTLYTDILLTSHTLKIGAESIHLLLRFLFCQQVPYLTLSTVERAIYYFNNEPPVRKLNGKPPVLFRTERVA